MPQYLQYNDDSNDNVLCNIIAQVYFRFGIHIGFYYLQQFKPSEDTIA